MRIRKLLLKSGRDEEDHQARAAILQKAGRESSHRQGSLEPVVEEPNSNFGLGQNMVMELSPILECRGDQGVWGQRKHS